MRIPYKTPPQTGLVVASGASKTFPISHPNRVRISDLSILQTAGAAVAFTAGLYSRDVPDTPSSNNADDIWRLFYPDIDSNAAGILSYRFADNDVQFYNQDDDVYLQAQGQPTPSLVSTTARRVIYLRITNSGGNSATFTAIIGSESETH